jgi:two-component system phosphate regulon sensor histidine kinase PhoR
LDALNVSDDPADQSGQGGKHDYAGRDIVTLIRDVKVLEAIDRVFVSGQSATVEMTTPAQRLLRVSVSLAGVGEKPSATIMIVDITAERGLEVQKADFFSNASHEMKTPVTSILGFSELLNRVDAAAGLTAADATAPSDSVKTVAGVAGGASADADSATTPPDLNVSLSAEQRSAALRRIEAEARRLAELIDDILLISNLESNTDVPKRTLFDFADIIEEVVACLPAQDTDRPITLNLQLEHLEVNANQRQMRELCTNLIENAIKYNKPGGSVTVSLKQDAAVAVLTVTDTGIGIAAENQERVFERFFRVETGRDKRVAGTGLGLSIVKHIVNLYAGEITLRSRPGTGTSIETRLPILD